jgi:integrase
MAAHQAHGRGSLQIDLSFGREGIGRIKVASGTDDEDLLEELKTMLRTLVRRMARPDLVIAVRDRHLTPLQLFEYYRTHRLQQVPTGDALVPLLPRFAAWARDHDVGRHSKLAYQSVLARYRRVATSRSTLADLPGLLLTLREQAVTDGKRVAWNRTRVHSLTFLRTVLGPRHQLCFAVQDIKPLKVERKVPPIMEWEDVRGFIGEMATKGRHDIAAAVRFLALTGMRLDEYFGDGRWTVVEGPPKRYEIRGAKGGTPRAIPFLVEPFLLTTVTRRTLQDTMTQYARGRLTCHGLRRAYGRLLERAGIDRSRMKQYLGHGKRDVSDLYVWSEIRPFLAADTQKLRALIDLPEQTPEQHVSRRLVDSTHKRSGKR